MSRLAHNEAVDELGTDVGIDDTDDDGGNDDEREGGFLVSHDA
jgi:hypothetical protein